MTGSVQITDSVTDSTSVSDTQRQVAVIWSEVLQCGSVEADHNFFELGGDSLMSMMMLFRISDELHVDLPPGALSEQPTLAQFCALIDQLSGQRTGLKGAITPLSENAPEALQEGTF